MNRSLVTVLSYFVVALAVIGLMRWLRGRTSAPPVAGSGATRPASPPGPPLAGTGVPLPAALEPLRSRLEALLAPSARLQPGGEPVAQLGGLPRLPAGFAWPSSPARPMSFIGALDLAALRRAAPEAAPALPAEGRLLFFYDVEEMRWGFEPTDAAFFKLVHVKDGGKPQAAPAGATTFKERLLGARAARVLPGDEELPAGLDLGDADDAYFEHAAALTPEPDHRVGGPPAWIQGDDRESAAIAAVGGSSGTPEKARAARAKLPPGAAAEWRLLWQLDSDDDAGFMWGDVGRIYLLARDEDLRAGRFDRAWLVMQCY